MGKLLKKILQLGAVEKNKTVKEKQNVTEITNSVLFDEIVEHFKQRIEKDSIPQTGRMFYPMSFNILMHPDDFSTRKDYLPFIIPEVVKYFYHIIKEKKSKYPNCAPPATDWFFQFVPCRLGESDGQDIPLERGQVITTGNPTTFDIRNDVVHSENNILVSVKCQNSNVNANNINVESLRGLNMLDDKTFIVRFDKDMSEDTRVIETFNKNHVTGLAELRWSEGREIKIYTMLDTYIDISGSAEKRTARNICPIKSDAVTVSHVQIKYDPQKQDFQLAAWAKTRLNSREVPLSTEGMPCWIPLPRFHSKLFLNDSVSIEFNAISEEL